ncbi:MAG: ribosome small subunit-dependent GTPase A [Lachnospiraceae bacterium]|nr:ribosome small subunit-dependent GTPase A [Lachnospiraceae bacterium]
MEEYTGRIVRGVGGFYYVDVPQRGIFQCRAKGLFRNEHIRPLVGDMARLHEVVDTDVELAGSIDGILERKSELQRPAIANVDRAVVIFAAADPDPNLSLLDRLLCELERQSVESVVCFNKRDLAESAFLERLREIYESAGYRVVTTCAKTGEISELKEAIRGHVATLAGPSGAGKSSVVNLLQSSSHMETGTISKKLGRGRHTTRHAQLFSVDGCEDTYIADTPGFSDIELGAVDERDLGDLFPEIRPLKDKCRFAGCAHIKEKDCAVKAAVREKLISPERYGSYKSFYQEIKAQRRY